MASGFFAKFRDGPLDGRLEWVRDGQNRIEIREKPAALIRQPDDPPPRRDPLRRGWYESTGPQTEDGYIFTWRGWE